MKKPKEHIQAMKLVRHAKKLIGKEKKRFKNISINGFKPILVEIVKEKRCALLLQDRDIPFLLICDGKVGRLTFEWEEK